MEKASSGGAHTQEEQILDNFFEEGPYPLRRASLRLPSASPPTLHETAERGTAPELAAAPPCRPVVLRYIVREPSATPHHQHQHQHQQHQQQHGAGAPPPLVTEWLVEDVLPLLPASALHLLALAQRYTLVTLSTPRRRHHHLHSAGPAPPHEGDEGLRTQRVGTVSDATLRRLLADIVAASTSSGSADGGDGAVVREFLAALALRLSPSPSLLSRYTTTPPPPPPPPPPHPALPLERRISSSAPFVCRWCPVRETVCCVLCVCVCVCVRACVVVGVGVKGVGRTAEKTKRICGWCRSPMGTRRRANS